MKWKPKEYEYYYKIIIAWENEIRKIKYYDNKYHGENVRAGNCFKLKREAQTKLKQILELLKK